jgi:2-oxoglutarate ferredoxin oxidoreductase subunit gamma
VVFVNASIIPVGAGRADVDELRVPIIELAGELGNVKAANIVALAAFVARSRIVSFEALTAAVKEKFADKAKLIPLNLKALEAGRKAAAGG